jgi:hypothetical protein
MQPQISEKRNQNPGSRTGCIRCMLDGLMMQVFFIFDQQWAAGNKNAAFLFPLLYPS